MENFFNLVSDCLNLQEFVNKSAEIIHCPYWVMDESFHILALSDNALSYRKKFYSDESLIDHVAKWQKTGMFEELAKTHKPVRIYDDNYSMNVVIMDVFLRSHPIGRLTVFEENPVDDETVKNLEQCISIYLRTLNPGHNHGPAEQMLSMLIDGESITEKEIETILSQTGLPHISEYIVACMRADRNNIWMMEALRSDLSHTKPDWVTVRRDQSIYILLPEGDKNLLPSEETIHAGVSFPFKDLKDLYSYAIQAEYAAENAHQSITFFEECLPSFTASVLTRTISLSSLILPSIQKIIAYDREYGTMYLETLAAYYENGQSKARTSRALEVHLNTVKYRLAQIQQLFHIDLEKDGENAGLSLMFLKYMKMREKAEYADRKD